MTKHRHPLLIVGFLMIIASAGAGQVNTVKPGEQVERNLPGDQPSREWSHYPDNTERGDRLEMRQVAAEKPETVKLKNVVPPIHFESGVAKIPPDYVDRLAKILASMR